MERTVRYKQDDRGITLGFDEAGSGPLSSFYQL